MSLAWDSFCSFGSPSTNPKKNCIPQFISHTSLLITIASFSENKAADPANLLPSTPTKSLLNLRQTAIYTFILDVHKDNTLQHRAHMSYYCV